MENTTKSIREQKKIKRPRDLISSYKKKHREERKERKTRDTARPWVLLYKRCGQKDAYIILRQRGAKRQLLNNNLHSTEVTTGTNGIVCK